MSEDAAGEQGRGQVEHATSVGQTGGLPGDNAHWWTSRLAEDELASTVQRGDVAAGSQDPQTSDAENLDARLAAEEDVANGDGDVVE